MRDIRVLLAIEAAALGGAAILHLPASGDPTESASIYEGTIAVILIVGLAIVLALPSWGAWAALLAQAFGLIGASIGLYLALRGVAVAPNTPQDNVFHVAIIVLLVWGLFVAWRARTDRPSGARAAAA